MPVPVLSFSAVSRYVMQMQIGVFSFLHLQKRMLPFLHIFVFLAPNTDSFCLRVLSSLISHRSLTASGVMLVSPDWHFIIEYRNFCKLFHKENKQYPKPTLNRTQNSNTAYNTSEGQPKSDNTKEFFFNNPV